MKRWLLGWCLAAAACSGPQAPWPTAPALALDLKITVVADAVPLLQPVTVLLDLYRREDLEVEFAPEVDATDFLSETTTLTEVPFGPGRWRRTVLVLRPVRGPGELVLPPFSARAVDGSVTATTPEQKIVVTSLLGDHGSALEAPGEPFPAPVNVLAWVGASVGVLALGVLAWFLTRRARTRSSPAEIAAPPHIVALRALQRLRGAPRTTPAEIEAFYVDVSSVLRVYLEARFGLRAPERTTEEFLRDLESGDGLVREHRQALEQFLSQCDLVKFAAYRPAEKDHLATFAIAEAFVERTRADRADARPAAAETVEEVPA